MTQRDLVLDAMGVIYESCDDVAELLVPFIQSRTNVDSQTIERSYQSASLGHISSSEFWKSVGLDSSIEDEYLSKHSLAPGLFEFLESAREYVDSIWCLSNDVSEWSQKLRCRFDIERELNGFVISGDVGMRKPDVNVYAKFIDMSGLDRTGTIFVDDRPKNLVAAQTAGLSPVLFGSELEGLPKAFPQVSSFDELLEILRK